MIDIVVIISEGSYCWSNDYYIRQWCLTEMNGM